MSSFKGFTGGDVEPPHQPESPPYDEGDENLPIEEFIKKHAISDESKAELRRSLKAEWTPKLLGKKYVKNTSDDPQTFSNIDLPTTVPYRLIHPRCMYTKGFVANRVTIWLDKQYVCHRCTIMLSLCSTFPWPDTCRPYDLSAIRLLYPRPPSMIPIVQHLS